MLCPTLAAMAPASVRASHIGLPMASDMARAISSLRAVTASAHRSIMAIRSDRGVRLNA